MKTISEFPNYLITKDGRIWSKSRIDIAGRRLRGKWLKPYKRKDGYLCASLCKNKKQHKKLVHRLVLETFVGFCPIDMECCHNNDDPTNNHVSNLRWDTRKANVRDAIKHNLCLKGEKNGSAKLTENSVRIIIYMWKTNLFLQKEIAKTYDVSKMTINDIIHKRTWKHIWCNW